MATLPITPPSDAQFGVNIGSYACGVPSPSKKTSRADTVHGLPSKPKQSKSRNGCITCKAKRLKCDETKPTCLQCQKRGVECGGFKKDFKWRPFEESSIAGKGSKPSKRAALRAKKSPSPPDVTSSPKYHRSESDTSFKTQYTSSPTTPEFPTFDRDTLLPTDTDTPAQVLTPPSLLSSPRYTSASFESSPVHQYDSTRAPIPRSVPNVDDIYTNMQPQLDSLLDSVDFPTPPPSQYELSIGEATSGGSEDEEIDEILRTPNHASTDWLLAPSSSSTDFPQIHSTAADSMSIHDIFRRPAVQMNSTEMLLSHFDKHTCGIMSVKDGPTENPWRTLIWPMAQDSPALFHAVSAMTAFHMSRSHPNLRVDGMEHMRKSIQHLAHGLSNNNIREDSALATTLVLAFSEAFDRHISTGIEHLRGARGLLTQALSKPSNTSNPVLVQRYGFLYNVWVYLDVLARLTSNAPDNLGTSLLHRPFTNTASIDPLLGCAGTLFPLLARAACIGQSVRCTPTNTLDLLTDALFLQRELDAWAPPSRIIPPQDESHAVPHCVNTAEAYRGATLLYLYETIPELPAASSAPRLAAEILRLISTIPITSRVVVVHIFPLLAAGCEVDDPKQREWVKKRWEGMMERMWIGNVEKAYTVTKEVWRRRDAVLEREKRSGGGVEVGGMREEFTARGKAHWLNVMRDWNWEVLLG